MLQYVRRLQGTNKVKGASLVVTIPHPLMQVLELSKGDNIVLELARDKNEKVIVLRKMQKEELESQENQEYRVNVIT
jgi:antitoxin component of MazEF toxin-antitoxin module